MVLGIACPSCGESEDLSGEPTSDGTKLSCGVCGRSWLRNAVSRCHTCGSDDLQTVPLAIVERSRGTQLSILGTRPIELCSVCDAAELVRYHAHRPNPLMPKQLPTVGPEQMTDGGA